MHCLDNNSIDKHPVASLIVCLLVKTAWWIVLERHGADTRTAIRRAVFEQGLKFEPLNGDFRGVHQCKDGPSNPCFPTSSATPASCSWCLRAIRSLTVPVAVATRYSLEVGFRRLSKVTKEKQ